MDYFLEEYSPKSQVSSQIIFICYNAFFLLNIYWFILIHKVLLKSILKKMGDFQQIMWSEYLCSYTFFLNVPICIYLYSVDEKQRYIFDIIGVITLSLMSYKFHRRLYLQMKNGEIITNEIPYFENMFEYLNDQIAIHLRSFFAIVSCHYDKNENNGIIFISMIIHLTSFYNMVLNIIYLYDDYNHNKMFFQKINMMCISICVAFDIFSIYMNTNEKEIAFPFLIVGITMFMVLVMKPFYHLTHTAFHVLLILNTYYTCLSNISV